jgi:predicted exporter
MGLGLRWVRLPQLMLVLLLLVLMLAVWVLLLLVLMSEVLALAPEAMLQGLQRCHLKITGL